MKHVKRFTAMVLAAALLLCTGCGGQTVQKKASCDQAEPASALCLVIGNHDNFPAVSMQQFYENVYAACLSYGSVAAVSVEGTPQVICDFKINPPDVHVDGTKRKQIAKENTNAILSRIASACALTPETDSLEALRLAGDLLDGKSGSKQLVMVDSFLSTAGLLDFTNPDLIGQDPASLVEKLKKKHSIPDLSGVQMTVLGLGCTAGKQAQPDAETKYKLQAIWEAILNATGADVCFDRTPVTGPEPQGLPAVSTVPMHSEGLVLEKLPEISHFDEAQLAFTPDTDRFADKTQARATLRPIADVLKKTGQCAVLAGSTASAGDAEDCLALSLARAEAVKTLLMELGVPENQLRCVGLGRSNHPLRKPDTDAYGRLIEDKAQYNRAVFVLSEDAAGKNGVCGEV